MADQPSGSPDRGRAPETNPDKGRTDGPIAKALAPVAGFGVSFATMFRKVYTEEYPEKPRPTEPRFHGRHQLNRHPDGLEKCIGCELCAWACPTRALTMTNEYEIADDRRGKLIFDKEQLLAPLQQGMLRAPHPMVPGADDQTYYRGEVTKAVPEQQAWVDAHPDVVPESVEVTGPKSAGERVAKATR